MISDAFNLNNPDSYLSWREQKLSNYSGSTSPIGIKNLVALDTNEINAIKDSIKRRNFALYQLDKPDQATPETLLKLCNHFGLQQNDHNICAEDIGVTAIQVKRDPGRRYIPYTDKPLSWHTDGYYNKPSQQINAWLLHCSQQASEGGCNELMDHEIAYIRLRDENPDFVAALQHAEAMTIPANIDNGIEIRAAQTGPVFSYNPIQQRLHMRYSARLKNVIWYDNNIIKEATSFLNTLFAKGDEHLHRLKLNSGQGVLSNNILHRREGFSDAPDEPDRLLYRVRYYNSVKT